MYRRVTRLLRRNAMYPLLRLTNCNNSAYSLYHYLFSFFSSLCLIFSLSCFPSLSLHRQVDRYRYTYAYTYIHNFLVEPFENKLCYHRTLP